jgi:hypothetical protein
MDRGPGTWGAGCGGPLKRGALGGNGGVLVSRKWGDGVGFVLEEDAMVMSR